MNLFPTTMLGIDENAIVWFTKPSYNIRRNIISCLIGQPLRLYRVGTCDHVGNRCDLIIWLAGLCDHIALIFDIIVWLDETCDSGETGCDITLWLGITRLKLVVCQSWYYTFYAKVTAHNKCRNYPTN